MADPESKTGDDQEAGIPNTREDRLVSALHGKTIQIGEKDGAGVAREIERAFLSELRAKVYQRAKPDSGDLYTYYILTFSNTIYVHVSEAGAVTASKAK